ncbi:MAG: hypothetical protein VW600_04990 [Ferrovibrio sp.]
MAQQHKRTSVIQALRLAGLAVATIGFAAAAEPAAAQMKVAMLLPGSINDQSWNAQGYAGLRKI